jgi:hypothetical protein
LLSVSARGELAVLVAPPRETGTVWLGTLARVPLSGGPLRPVLEGVLDADWSPDGRDLAAIRWHEGQFQLEYPLGTVLRRPCPGTKLRVSPRGDQVALLEDRGGVLIVGRDGSSRTLEVPRAHQRLAWSADGQSLLVDAGDIDLRRTLRRVGLGGDVTEICALAGTLVVHDVSRDGRVLLHHGFERWTVRARAPGEAEEHDASVFANSQVQGLSADGNQLLLWDGGEGPPGAALLLPTRGGAAVRLGDGHPVGLSADAAWVLMETADRDGSGLQLVPTGVGHARRVPMDGRTRSSFGPWYVGADAVGFHAAEPGRPARSFVANLAAGKVRAVTPEGMIAIDMLPGSQDMLARSSDGRFEVHSMSGGNARAIAWTLPSDPFLDAIRVSGDSRYLFVREGSVPARLDRIELETGRREPWKTLTPAETTGAGHVWSVVMTPEGDGYAYTHGLFLQDLFLVDGLP